MAQVLGSVFGAAGQIQQAEAQAAQLRSQAQAAKFNEAVAVQNAELASQVADIEAQEIRRETQRNLGRIRATAAASGVLSSEGSPYLALIEQAAEGELSAQKRLFQGELQSRADLTQAALLEQEQQNAYIQARATARGGRLTAAGTFTSAVADQASSGGFLN